MGPSIIGGYVARWHYYREPARNATASMPVAVGATENEAADRARVAMGWPTFRPMR